MAIYRRAGQKAWLIAVPTRHGRKKLSTGVTYKPTARSMDRMLAELGPTGQRAWDLLDRVADGSLSMGALHDAWSANDLDGLRVRLSAAVDTIDLSAEVDEYLKRLGKKGRAEDTVSHYRHILRSFIPEGQPFGRSAFTSEAIDSWLTGYPGSDGTRRKAHAAMSGFGKYLARTRKVIPANPVRDVEAPPPGAPRLRWLEVTDMKRLADAQPEPYRTLSAILGGTGIEVSVALALHRRDVDVQRREIRAAGTKTYCRDRTVRVAEWAWSYVERHIADMLPNAPLFPDINRFTASDVHRDTCKALDPAIVDYQLRDQRHSYAVRAARAGTPAELIARQLGHANAVLVLRVY